MLGAGPMGQCHPIPDSPALRAQMLRAARNYQRIYNMYNLPYQVRETSQQGVHPCMSTRAPFCREGCWRQAGGSCVLLTALGTDPTSPSEYGLLQGMRGVCLQCLGHEGCRHSQQAGTVDAVLKR